MHGEDLLVNDGRNGQAVEAVGECLPELDIVSSLALVIEAVDTVDGGTLMVAAQNEEVLGVLDLVGKKQADGLERLLATVDVITKEQIVGLRRESTVLEKTQEVVVLSVDITADLERAQTRQTRGMPGAGKVVTNLDGSFQLEQNGLRDEDLASFGAEITDL